MSISVHSFRLLDVGVVLFVVHFVKLAVVLLQILKNQVGGAAPDAAALMSRGDSLVYAAHARSPLLADYLLTHYQVPLPAYLLVTLLEQHRGHIGGDR